MINDLKNKTEPFDPQCLYEEQKEVKGNTILGLYGQESDALPIAQEVIAPYGELICFPQATHAVLWEKTDQVLSTLVQWLNP